MFGGKRRKAVSTATEAVSPFIRAFESTSGLPTGFWRDPYVVGFLSGCVAIFAKMSTGWRIAGGDLGRVMIKVFDQISGGQGAEIAAFGLDCQQAQDPEYSRGIRNADKSISVAYGLGDYSHDPDVRAAREAAKDPRSPANVIDASGGMGDKVGGALLYRLFYQEVRDRLG